MTDLRILVVAENLLARVGLATLLTGQPGCLVVGQIGGSVDFASELELYRPEVIVFDLGWTPLPTIEQLAALPDMPIVALLPDEEQITPTVNALRRNTAYGLLLRDTAPETVVAALNAVLGGLVVLDPALMTSTLALLPASENGLPTAEPLADALTPRELEVLQLIAEGQPNKLIANNLGISEHTVKFHVNSVMTKLGAQSRTEAVVRATRLGLIIL
jgi:DNA-binding NarL/FixJ family response regulator